MSSMTWRNKATGHVKLTYDDLLHLPEDGLRHEIVDGEHFVSAAPNTRHQRLVRRLTVALGAWLEDHGIGELFPAPFDVVLSRHDVVEPDLVFLSNVRAATALNAQYATAADLVVEVLSPATRQRDESLKRALYERAGVVEYWCVDPDADEIHVHRRRGGSFETPETYCAVDGHMLVTPLLPGFELPLAALFSR